MSSQPRVLVVEDSKFFASLLCRRIENELGFEVHWRSTYAEAAASIDCCKDEYLVALLDVTLPDAPNGEIVEYALKHKVPSIIYTGGLDSNLRTQFLKWNIVDYILKDSSSSIDTLLATISRVYKNQKIKTLVVDDSKTQREALAGLLHAQLYEVLEAANGQEALEIISQNPEIKLVVTDYDMPIMDGFELIKILREKHSKNELAIIGMSASGDPLLSARLIKTGANDFVSKPFQVEEFHCRVGHSIEMLENIELIRDLSYKDPLTRLYNRRYFFENANKFIEKTKQSGLAYCVGMLDIDFFKKVNDNYGHDGGDEVLKAVSAIIADNFREDAIVCRFGGEEFCVVVAHSVDSDIVDAFEFLRKRIEAASVQTGGQTVKVTISTGICCEPTELDDMLKLADSRLYTAKETGRNRVVAAPPSPNVRS